MSKVAIILATSRKNGNTSALVAEVAMLSEAKIFDLNHYKISAFDYNHLNREDDFLGLISELISFEHIVFASPVYWYSICGQMKIFLDRFTDLLTVKKAMGRALRNKSASLIATGSDIEVPVCYEEPMSRTLSYLGMNYTGMLYCHCDETIRMSDNAEKIADYVKSKLVA